MRTLVWPAQEGMSSAVARITGSLRGPSSSEARRPAAAWHSLWRRVAGKSANAPHSPALGSMSPLRAMATAAGPGPSSVGSSSDGPRVCILGGGFGGLYTAVKLEGLMWPRGTKPRVTLVDQAERFTFKPLLYELLTGAATVDEVAPTYAQLLTPYPVTFVRGKVSAVRPESTGPDSSSDGGGTVLLSSGEAVPYDWLVLALGAETVTYGVPGVKEHAIPFSSYEDAVRVAAKLDILSTVTSPEVVVVGGGYAGVELAAAVAEKLGGRGRIQLVTTASDILAESPAGQRDAARRALQDSNISMLTSAAVTEVRVAAAGGAEATSTDTAKRLVYVKDASGQTEILEADLVVWTAGQAPVPRVEASSLALPFPMDQRGAMQTDPTLRVLRNQHVFALGDVAVSGADPAKRLPATAQVAFQQADYVAWNIWASINNRPLLKFNYQHLGDMMSLGATKGAVSLPIPVPPPVSAAVQGGPVGELLRLAGVKVNTTYNGASDGVTLEGPLAALMRRAAYLYRQPTDQQRLRVAASWAGQASQAAADIARQVLAGGPLPSGGSSSTGGRKNS